MDVVECLPQKSVLGKAFKQDAKIIMEHLSKLDASAVAELEQALSDKGYGQIAPAALCKQGLFSVSFFLFLFRILIECLCFSV